MTTAWPPAPKPIDRWMQALLAEGIFMYVGLAVAAAWLSMLVAGRWRPPTDALDRIGRVVGGLWIVVSLEWTAWRYIDLLL